MDALAVGAHPANGTALHNHALHLHLRPEIHSVALEFLPHQQDQPIRSPLKDVDALAHKIGIHDAVADGGIIQRGSVGIGDRFHQQTPNRRFPRKEPFKQFARGHLIIVVEIHAARRIEKTLDGSRLDRELFYQDPSEISAIERGGKLKLRIIKPDAFELHDGVRNLLRPILPAALDHPDGKTVQGDIKQIAALASKPGGHPTVVIVLLKQEYGSAALG